MREIVKFRLSEIEKITFNKNELIIIKKDNNPVSIAEIFAQMLDEKSE